MSEPLEAGDIQPKNAQNLSLQLNIHYAKFTSGRPKVEIVFVLTLNLGLTLIWDI